MSWERDPLLAKARLYVERGLEYSREDPQFGLWCAFGLELLARAAVASVSPALLAEPTSDQKSLLHALGKGDPRTGPKSIAVAQVIRLCQYLFKEFSAEDATAALALINRRNEELHTGASAFDEYTTRQWIGGFYRCCKSLASVLGEPLETILGPDEAAVAMGMLTEIEKEVRQRVNRLAASHRDVFQSRSVEERDAQFAAAKAAVDKLVHQRHHRVDCPSCGANATVQGDTFGPVRVTHDEDDDGMAEVVVRQAVVPRNFLCQACGLRLDGYAELLAANLGDQYSRTTRYTPSEFYELIDPNDDDAVRALVDEHSDEYGYHRYEEEYDNE